MMTFFLKIIVSNNSLVVVNVRQCVAYSFRVRITFWDANDAHLDDITLIINDFLVEQDISHNSGMLYQYLNVFVILAKQTKCI